MICAMKFFENMKINTQKYLYYLGNIKQNKIKEFIKEFYYCRDYYLY